MMADYLKGQLSDNEQLDLENHFLKCESCSELVNTTEEIVHGDECFNFKQVPAHVTQSAVRAVSAQIQGWPASVREKTIQSVKTIVEKILVYITSEPYCVSGYTPVPRYKKSLPSNHIILKKPFKLPCWQNSYRLS